MKRYLITGFSGFVSYYFLKYLDERASKEGNKVEVLGLDLAKPASYEQDYRFTNLTVRFMPLNLLDGKGLEIALQAFFPDYVLHLASLSSVGESWRKPVDSYANNTNIFLNLADAVRRNGIKCRILSVGSSEEYGNVSKEAMPLREDMSLAPLSPYAIARVSQEMLSRCYVKSFGQDIVMTRSFNHIGPRQREAFVIPSFVKQLVYGAMDGKTEIEMTTGDTSIVRDFTDVRDVVRAYDLLLREGESGEVYNVCKGEGHALGDIIGLIAGKLGVEARISVDRALVRPNDNMVIVGDNSKLKGHTGWEPNLSLEDTIDDMIGYWKERCLLEKNTIDGHKE